MHTHTYRQTDRQTHRQTDRQTHRQTDRQTDIYRADSFTVCMHITRKKSFFFPDDILNL